MNQSLENFRLALAGDAIINRRVSDQSHPDVRAILDHLSSAHVAFANCEMLFHDYCGEGVYPSAEAGGSYMRSPPEVASDLRKCGIRLLSMANNHALDYSYGGLFSTWAELAKAGIAHAGSGCDLAAARSPAFLDTGSLRVSLVSMTTTSTPMSRAGMPHDGIPGRPGVNPLRYHFQINAETMKQVIDLYTKLGWWVARVREQEWQTNPPGLHNSITRWFVSEQSSEGMVLDKDDVRGNLEAIRNAKTYSDIMIAHVHNHEWDQSRGPEYPPEFLPPFAKMAIDAGADVVVAQGAHAPFRGIEIYKGKPIFYDIGDIFSMSSTITRYPHDFYVRYSADWKKSLGDALTFDVLPARSRYIVDMAVNPKGGTRQGRGQSGVIPVLDYDRAGRLVRLTLNPFSHRHGAWGEVGLPFRVSGNAAQEIIGRFAALSAPFQTKVLFAGEVGIVSLD